jgi:DNA-binding transcriptional MerR regulator
MRADTARAGERAGAIRIGELAAQLGVSTDTIRFYEKQGWLPGPRRSGNSYREYTPEDLEHARLLLELRRLDIPLPDAARVAAWCHSGHCADATGALPDIIAERRRSVAERIESLAALDARLARLERHLRAAAGGLAVIDVGGQPCCESAAAIGSVPAGCACCAPEVGA